MRTITVVGALLGAAAACAAQQHWELGGALGYGVYRNGSINAPAGTATAGYRNRFVASAVIGEDLYEHLAGEFRYVYHDGDPFLSAGGVKENLQGQSHTFVYDVLFHFLPRDASLRPYLATGVGAKLFVVSGPPNPSQPLSGIGGLTTNDQIRLAVSLGGGVKWRLCRHVLARLDFRDYVSPFPKRQLVPAAFGTGHGILHQYTPMAALSYSF